MLRSRDGLASCHNRPFSDPVGGAGARGRSCVAYLSEACLWEADLIGADLSEADLSSANKERSNNELNPNDSDLTEIREIISAL